MSKSLHDLRQDVSDLKIQVQQLTNTMQKMATLLAALHMKLFPEQYKNAAANQEPGSLIKLV